MREVDSELPVEFKMDMRAEPVHVGYTVLGEFGDLMFRLNQFVKLIV